MAGRYSAAYKCGSTAGQTAVGLATASGLQVFAGFWLPDYGVGIEKRDEVGTGSVRLMTKLETIAPNPARQRVAIRHSPADDGLVSLMVCDLTGRVVREPIGASVRRGSTPLSGTAVMAVMAVASCCRPASISCGSLPATTGQRRSSFCSGNWTQLSGFSAGRNAQPSRCLPTAIIKLHAWVNGHAHKKFCPPACTLFKVQN